MKVRYSTKIIPSKTIQVFDARKYSLWMLMYSIVAQFLFVPFFTTYWQIRSYTEGKPICLDEE